jgi:phospholipid N-methyltransferase
MPRRHIETGAISYLSRGILNQSFASVELYAEYVGILLQTFRDKLSVAKYRSTLRKTPEERRSQHLFCSVSVFLQFTIAYRGHAVAQLVEALRYKSEGRGFDSR